MIGKAKAISHGYNDLRYITGESKNKKHPELITRICDQYLLPNLDAKGIWNAFQLNLGGHNRIKNSLIRIEISPAREYTKNFTSEDWKQLWDDIIEECDKIGIEGADGKVHHTNLARSRGTVWLHEESKGKVPHLHGAVCRVDEAGKTNVDYQIDKRMQWATERVAERRGWTTAATVHIRNANQLYDVCQSILRDMDEWNLDEFFQRLKYFDLEIKSVKDASGNVIRYGIKDGNAYFPSSEIGRSRHMTVAHLPFTWRMLHYDKEQEQIKNTRSKGAPIGDISAKGALITEANAQGKPEEVTNQQQAIAYNEDNPIVQNQLAQAKFQFHDYSIRLPNTTRYELEQPTSSFFCFIPNKVLDFFENEFDYREVSNHFELKQLAVALFTGLLQTEQILLSSGGGGGNASELPWRDKDDDDLEWARRCARFSTKLLGKQIKKGRRY